MPNNSKTPCWLNREQLEQAEALIKLGFCYCGNEDDYWGNEDDFCKDWLICKVSSWAFYSAIGELGLKAICEGALYHWELDVLPDCTISGFFEARVKEAKTAIRNVIKSQKARTDAETKQLSLFN